MNGMSETHQLFVGEINLKIGKDFLNFRRRTKGHKHSGSWSVVLGNPPDMEYFKISVKDAPTPRHAIAIAQSKSKKGNKHVRSVGLD